MGKIGLRPGWVTAVAGRRGGGGGSGKWTPVTGRSKEASLKALMMAHHVQNEDFFCRKISPTIHPSKRSAHRGGSF